MVSTCSPTLLLKAYVRPTLNKDVRASDNGWSMTITSHSQSTPPWYDPVTKKAPEEETLAKKIMENYKCYYCIFYWKSWSALTWRQEPTWDGSLQRRRQLSCKISFPLKISFVSPFASVQVTLAQNCHPPTDCICSSNLFPDRHDTMARSCDQIRVSQSQLRWKAHLLFPLLVTTMFGNLRYNDPYAKKLSFRYNIFTYLTLNLTWCSLSKTPALGPQDFDSQALAQGEHHPAS